MIGVVFYQNSLVTELYSVVLFVRVSELSFLNSMLCVVPVLKLLWSAAGAIMYPILVSQT